MDLDRSKGMPRELFAIFVPELSFLTIGYKADAEGTNQFTRRLNSGVGGRAVDRRAFFFLGSSSTQQSQGWTLVEQLKQRWLELFSLSPYIIDRNMLMIAQPNDCILPKIEWSKAWDRGFREFLAREKVSVGAR